MPVDEDGGLTFECNSDTDPVSALLEAIKTTYPANLPCKSRGPKLPMFSIYECFFGYVYCCDVTGDFVSTSSSPVDELRKRIVDVEVIALVPEEETAKKAGVAVDEKPRQGNGAAWLDHYVILLVNDTASPQRHLEMDSADLRQKLNSSVVKIIILGYVYNQVAQRKTITLHGHEQLPFILTEPPTNYSVRPNELPSSVNAFLNNLGNGENLLKNVQDPKFAIPKVPELASAALIEGDQPRLGLQRSARRIREIKNLRSIATLKSSGSDRDATGFHLDSPFVIFHGENGMGKTSLLEAIYYAMFRMVPLRRTSSLISHGADKMECRIDSEESMPNECGQADQLTEPVTVIRGDRSYTWNEIAEQTLVDFIRNGRFFNDRIPAVLFDDLTDNEPKRIAMLDRLFPKATVRVSVRRTRILTELEKVVSRRKRMVEDAIEMARLQSERLFTNNKSKDAEYRGIQRRLKSRFDVIPSIFGQSLLHGNAFKRAQALYSVEYSSSLRSADIQREIDSLLSSLNEQLDMDIRQLAETEQSINPSKDMDSAREAHEVLLEIKSIADELPRLLQGAPAPEDQVAALEQERQRLIEWTEALPHIRGCLEEHTRATLEAGLADFAARAPLATAIYRGINPQGSRGVRFAAESPGAPLLQLWGRAGSDGNLRGLSAWHELSAGERLDLGLSAFLARTLDPDVRGTFLLDEPFLHLDADRRTNLLDIMRAIIVRRNGAVNFIITTTDEYFQAHAAQKMLSLNRAKLELAMKRPNPEELPRVLIHTLTRGENGTVVVKTSSY